MLLSDVIDIKLVGLESKFISQVEKITDMTVGSSSYNKVIWQVPRCTAYFRDNIPVNLFYDIGDDSVSIVGDSSNHGDVTVTVAAPSPIKKDVMYLVPVNNIRCANDIMSGFTSDPVASYAHTPICIDWTSSNSFEIILKIKTGKNVSTRQELFSMEKTESMELEILNGKLHWELAGATSSIYVNADTVYWVKFTKSKTSIVVSYSTNGTDYVETINSTCSRTVTNERMHFGIDRVAGGTIIEPFLGEIDLSQCYITYDGVKYSVKLYDDEYMTLVRDGNITVNDVTQDVTGFTTNNHAHTPFVINWTNTNETTFIICFTTTNDTSKLNIRQELFGMQSTDNFELEIYNAFDGKPRLHWELLGYGSDSYGKTELKTNTKYYVKFEKNKTTYTLSMSENDNKNYKVEIGPTSCTRICNNEYMYIGLDKQSICEPFTGTIHVSECYLKYNNKNYRCRI